MVSKKGKPRFEKLIKNMYPDETGFTVPWAVEIDERGKVLLNTKYTVNEKKVGIMMMKIKRTGIKLTDYDIDFTSVGSYKWNTGKGLKWENLQKFDSDIINISTLSMSEVKKIYKTNLSHPEGDS